MAEEETGQQVETNTDAGFDMDSFLDGPTATEETTSEPSGEVESKEKTKAESDPGGDDTKETPSGETATEDQTKVAEAKPEEKSDDEAKTEDKTDETKGEESKWDSEDNPYRKQVEVAEKRMRDAQSWGNTQNQETIALRHEIGIVNKKLDGTYDPDVDSAPVVSNEQVAQTSEMVGRIKASEELVSTHYGQEFVEKRLAEFGELAQEHPELKQQVLQSKAPAYAALQIMDERDFKVKYGTDAKQIIQNIRAEFKEELAKEVKSEESKKMKERLSLKNKQAGSLSGVKGSSDQGKVDESGGDALNEIFPDY